MGKTVWHWVNRELMYTAIKAHCGLMFPNSLTSDPKAVTCKNCIKRGFDYGGSKAFGVK